MGTIKRVFKVSALTFVLFKIDTVLLLTASKGFVFGFVSVAWCVVPQEFKQTRKKIATEFKRWRVSIGM